MTARCESMEKGRAVLNAAPSPESRARHADYRSPIILQLVCDFQSAWAYVIEEKFASKSGRWLRLIVNRFQGEKQWAFKKSAF